MKVEKISENIYEIQKTGDMNVPARIFASEKLMASIKKDDSLNQVVNVAKLPGIIGASIAMPDIHQGYGFSIGGVAAFDTETGVVSPGGVGFDINCGVRFLATDIPVEKFLEKRSTVLEEISRTIPKGVGRENKEKLEEGVLDEILIKGAFWAVENGYGEKSDLENTEEGGMIPGADPAVVSPRAKARGRPQLGTLGAGNHFLEIQKVSDILSIKEAKKMGIKKDTVGVMIHCGSRGLGHQVASDYIQKMGKVYGFPEYDPQLVYAPLSSQLGQEYMAAMGCAINFAFCNRQIIMHKIRGVLEKFFPENKTHLVYDVAHNIAKFENHIIDGKSKKICIHRKGATRAAQGEPVIIPGSMGTSSYILIGGEKSETLSWASTAHGAGRVMGRKEANKKLDLEKIKESLSKKDIEIISGSNKGIVEEAPDVYKDIEEVIKVSNDVGLATSVAKLRPLAVIKG